MLKFIKILLLLTLITACTQNKALDAPKDVPKNDWPDFAARYCNSRVNERFIEAGYKENEKPGEWIKDRSTGSELIIKECSQQLLAAVNPCVIEYKCGSDSAIRCVYNYSTDFLLDFVATLKVLIPDKEI